MYRLLWHEDGTFSYEREISMYHRSINAVHVEATDRCNAQCPVCIRSFQGGPEREQYVTNSELGLKHFKKYLFPFVFLFILFFLIKLFPKSMLF